MNQICETCDTRCRLHMCQGQDGDFKYCYRPVDSVDNIPDNITPFNTVDELYEKNKWIKSVERDSLVFDDKPYGSPYMKLLLGHFIGDTVNDKVPVGFVICGEER